MAWVAALGAVSAVAGIAGGLKSSKAAKQQAAMAKKAADFNANILEGNADEVLTTANINAELNKKNTEVIKNFAAFNESQAIQGAKRVEFVTELAATRKKQEGERLTAAQTAAYTASGVTLSGSALDVMNDSRQQNNMDVLSIVYNGMVEASSMRSQAAMIKYQGEVDVYNSESKTKEILRTAAVDAENLRKEAELNRIRGDVAASSYKRQADAVMLNTATQSVGQFYDLYRSGAFDGFSFGSASSYATTDLGGGFNMAGGQV